MRCLETGVKLSHVDTTAVKLRPLADAEIDRYIEREKPFDCAGGFKAEALGITLFERIDTEDPTAIVGMPLIWLAGALRAVGLRRCPNELASASRLVARARRSTAARSAGNGALALKLHARFRPHEAHLVRVQEHAREARAPSSSR